MATIAKILPIPRVASEDKKSTANSLLRKGYNRQPGACVRIMPVRISDGRYLTGLDENAPSVLKIADKTEREIEQKRIKETRTRLENTAGINLGPKSDFYSKISQADRDGLYNNPKTGEVTKVAEMVRLQDGENIFNFEDPFQEITFLWVSQHPNVASSLEDFRTGKAKPSCQFYVCNPEIENKIIYTEKKLVNKCVIDLNNASLEKRKMIARLIGLPISESDKEDFVYNELDNFIKSGEVKAGEFKGYKAVTLFNQLMDLKDNMLTTKDLIKQALTFGVYKKKNGAIYEGENQVAENEDALLKILMSNDGQKDYLALDAKINNKKNIS